MTPIVISMIARIEKSGQTLWPDLEAVALLSVLGLLVSFAIMHMWSAQTFDLVLAAIE